MEKFRMTSISVRKEVGGSVIDRYRPIDFKPEKIILTIEYIGYKENSEVSNEEIINIIKNKLGNELEFEELLKKRIRYDIMSAVKSNISMNPAMDVEEMGMKVLTVDTGFDSVIMTVENLPSKLPNYITIIE